MSTQQALVLKERGEPLSLTEAPIPNAVPGSAIVKVLATLISPLARKVFNGELPFPLCTPTIPSSQAVGRIHALGPDSTSLQVGQLVFVDILTRSRDDPDDAILQGYMGGFGASIKLMEGEWRNGTWAQYAKMPLENLYPLNEDLLTKELGYSFADLSWLGPASISAAGLMDIGVKPGESVIIAPSSGFFGGTGVRVALAMGARVIAAARNEQTLVKMTETFKSTGRFTTVKLTGDIQTDTEALKKASGSSKGADAYVDWSPPQAAKSTHVQACLGALRPFGRCSLLGGLNNVELPYFVLVLNTIHIQGRFMYERQHVLQVIKLIEAGLLKLGAGNGSGIELKLFKMSDSNAALDTALTFSNWAGCVAFEP